MEKKQEISALVLRIEKSSIHDGEGFRTVVFLQGCNLRCAWCSTPESQVCTGSWGFDQERCQACGRCLAACLKGALQQRTDGFMLRDATLCTKCGACLRACAYQAHRQYGQWMSLSQIMAQILQDDVFYFHSGGGLTISGGEPLLQAEFCTALLRECHEQGINTALETSLAVNWAAVAQILPHLDTLYADLKHCNATQHLHWVRADNTEIMENLYRADAAAEALDIIIRVPLIPGINDDDENLLATAGFCTKLRKCRGLQLLPYHRLGSLTYAKLGRDYRLAGLAVPEKAHMVERQALIHRHYPQLSLLD